MPRMLGLLFLLIIRSVRSRHDLLLENLALRQQLAVLERRHPQSRFSQSDRLFWGRFAAAVAGMAKGIGPCPARHRHPLASNRIQTVLEMDFAQTCRCWKETDVQGTAGADLSHGGGESHLGRASDPWRTQNAGLRYFGTDRASMDAEGSKKP